MLPGNPVEEYRFHAVRKWRFDYAYVDKKIAVEIEGGIFVIGRHTRGAGFLKDMEKYNAAGLLGWRIFRFTPRQVKGMEAYAFIQKVLEEL